MYEIELTIKKKDWFYIQLLGILLGFLFSSFGYLLLNLSWLEGGLFGVLLGFSITLFSLIFITIMNAEILPDIPKKFWDPIAIFFSFLAGFLGSQMSIYTAIIVDLSLIPLFEKHQFAVSTFIGTLTYFIGVLLYQVVKMRNAREYADYEYLQNRMRSLELQLNPHFLFNALNSVAELIHQDRYKAEEAILKLSSFLRSSMNEQALISIERELSNVKDYVALENIRFNNKICLHVKHENTSMEVPKFSIQLIVENAIKHGFNNQNELNIFIETDAKNKTITISNDGLALEKRNFGIGLSNLEQRLKLLLKGSLQVLKSEPVTYIMKLGS
jgi:sensor histidine kinase YesM